MKTKTNNLEDNTQKEEWGDWKIIYEFVCEQKKKAEKDLLKTLVERVDKINGHYKVLKYSDRITKKGFAILDKQQKQRRIGLKMAIRDFKEILKKL